MTRSNTWINLAVFFLLIAIPAGATEMPLRWSDLSTALTRHTAATVELKDGATIRVRVEEVEAAALRVTVTSDVKPGYSKGPAEIPRDRIAGILLKGSGARARIMGTGLGAVAGVLIGAGIMAGYVANTGNLFDPNPGAVVASGSAIIGAPVAGYFIGKKLERKGTHLILLRDLDSVPLK